MNERSLHSPLHITGCRLCVQEQMDSQWILNIHISYMYFFFRKGQLNNKRKAMHTFMLSRAAHNVPCVFNFCGFVEKIAEINIY